MHIIQCANTNEELLGSEKSFENTLNFRRKGRNCEYIGFKIGPRKCQILVGVSQCQVKETERCQATT